MAGQIRFDDLVEALAGAVVEAEHVIRRNQIADLRTFFYADGSPVTITVHMPSIRPGAKSGELDELKVPLIALVNPTNLVIKHLEINFTTELGDVTEVEHTRAHALTENEKERDPTTDPSGAVRMGWSGRKLAQTINVTTPSDGIAPSPSAAKVTLRVEGGPAPEGVARLIERLTKLI